MRPCHKHHPYCLNRRKAFHWHSAAVRISFFLSMNFVKYALAHSKSCWGAMEAPIGAAYRSLSTTCTLRLRVSQLKAFHNSTSCVERCARLLYKRLKYTHEEKSFRLTPYRFTNVVSILMHMRCKLVNWRYYWRYTLVKIPFKNV